MLTRGAGIKGDMHPIVDLLQQLAGTLSSLSDELLSVEDMRLAKTVREAADALDAMSIEVGQGDLEVAWEIARSSARLVTTLRTILHQRSQSKTLH
jgi:hypothetical protein